jgi:hypothetical protein
MLDMETKQYLNRIYGMKVSHADMSKVNPINMVKTKDNALCMYDYAKEIIDITEGYADTDSVK